MKERQLEIIEAAGRILTSSGVKGVTIKNLAIEMQFSESAIYRHFKSKEDIIVTMLNYLAEDMDSRLTNAIRPEDSTEDKFRSLFNSQFTFFKSNPHFVALTIEEIVHIAMGTFRLQMFNWRFANFKFDIKRSGNKMMQSLLKMIQGQ